MKNIFTLNLTVLFFMLIFSPPIPAQINSYDGPTFKDARQQGSATLTALYSETPAFVFKDENGEMKGICVEMMSHFTNFLKHQYDLDIRIRYEGDGIEFNDLYESVRTSSGGVFGLANITITDERKQELDFTKPYIQNRRLLVTHKDAPELYSIHELNTKFKGYTIYVQKGTTIASYAKQIQSEYGSSLKIETATIAGDVIGKVVSNPESMAFFDVSYYLKYEKNYPVKYHDLTEVSLEDFGIIMPLNSDWKPIWDEFFEKGNYLSSNYYRQTLIKYIGRDFVEMLNVKQ